MLEWSQNDGVFEAVLRSALSPSLALVVAAALVGCGDAAPPAAILDAGADDGPAADSQAPDSRKPGPTVDELHIRVTDSKTGMPLPARVFMFRGGQPVFLAHRVDPPFCQGTGVSAREIGTGGALTTWNAIALWRGDAVIQFGRTFNVPTGACAQQPAFTAHLDSGVYTLKISRGPEYELADVEVDLHAGVGRVELNVPLARVVDTSGFLATDVHIHTTGSNDGALTPEHRAKSAVVNGVEVLVSTDHDAFTDLGDPIRKVWPESPGLAAGVVGEEASAAFGHFGIIGAVFVKGAPANGAPATSETGVLTPRRFFERMHGLPGSPFVVLNHPRLGWFAYFDDNACGVGGWRDHSKFPACAVDFDGIEVMSGFLGCETKIHAQIADWYGLLGLGVVTTALGGSDSHYDAGIMVGYARTYVRMTDDDPAHFRQDEFLASLRAHAAIASTGPFVNIIVDDSHHEGELVTTRTGQVKVKARLQFASWVPVDTLALLADGVVVKSWEVGRAPGVMEVEETLTIPRDTFITAAAWSKRPMPTWIVNDYIPHLDDPTTGIFQCPNDDGTGYMVPYAVTNAVLVDADGDGVFHAIRQPAARPEPAEFPVPPFLPFDGEEMSVGVDSTFRRLRR